MAYFERILNLLNLLCSRQCVTLPTIQEVCGIPERSVYRQLQQLSDAGFPVYYDKERGGYRMQGDRTPNLSRINADDVTSILTGLLLLRARVNDAYVEELDRLVQWLVSSSSISIEHLVSMIRSRLGQAAHDDDLSQVLSETRIRAAIESGHPVKLMPDNHGGAESIGWSGHVSLRHRGSWHVVSGDSDGEYWRDLASVERANIGTDYKR